jgi:outer membrane protein TolC
MKKSSIFKHRKYVYAGALIASLTSQAAMAADADAKKPLTLDDSVRIALKNASSLILARLQVQLASANEIAAGAPFDTSLKASAAADRVRGYRYPTELQNLPQNLANAANSMASYNAGLSNIGSSVAPAITVPALSLFMADHQDNQEFKTSLTKLFRNGMYADLSVTLDSSKNAKNNTDLQSAIYVLANGIPGFLSAVNPNINYSSYSTVHPSTIQMTLNFPLLKLHGEHNLPAAAETQKRLQREASENLVKHAVAGIIQNVITRYWDYKASLVKLQYTKESVAQIERWISQLEKNIKAANRPSGTAGDGNRELSFLKAFLTQTQASLNAAEETVNVSRNQLASDLGISRDEARLLGEAKDDYPLDWSATLSSYDDDSIRTKWNNLGNENRFDLRAAELQVRGANEIYLGAQNNALPKLDVAVIAKRQGLSVGGSNLPQLSSLSTGNGGLGGTLLVSFEYLLDNSAAKGLVGQTYLGKLQEEENYRNAKRTVGLSIDAAVTTVHNALAGLAQSKVQVAQYVNSLNSLVKNGNFPVDSTFDLVQIEQGRLKAFVDNVTAIQTVANAVTAAHFQTGTLTKQIGTSEEVSLEDITRLP